MECEVEVFFFSGGKKATETGNKATDRSDTKSTWFVINKSCSKKKRWESQGTIKESSLKMHLKFENRWTAAILDYPKAIIPESELEAAWVERQVLPAEEEQINHRPSTVPVFSRSLQNKAFKVLQLQPSLQVYSQSVTLREDRRHLWSMWGNRKLGTSAES